MHIVLVLLLVVADEDMFHCFCFYLIKHVVYFIDYHPSIPHDCSFLLALHLALEVGLVTGELVFENLIEDHLDVRHLWIK